MRDKTSSADDNFVLIEAGGKVYQFSADKNQYIQEKRGLNFNAIIPRLAAGDIVAIDDYPKGRDAQGARLYVIEINGYLHEVPFVEIAPHIIYLKNSYPSRKMMFRHCGIKRKSKRLKRRLKRQAALSSSVSVETFSVSISIEK